MQSRWHTLVCCGLALLSSIAGVGQGYCPANIGFENGSFSGWNCVSGKVDASGNVSMTPTAPLDNKHTIYKNASPRERDKYGGFPVNCPNTSNYSIRLGNDKAQSQADGVSYTFTVPAGQDDYSIIFNYAVVLQNPIDHKDYEQPKFTSKVFDVNSNKYLECGSFQFVAAPNLPGFKESPVEKYIYYKDWAPVTIKLTGFAGRTIRLEFTAASCAKGVHFGYAYLDVDENCTSPITGNTYCNGSGAVVLKAPYGFKEYKWYDEQSNLVGTGNTLRLDPPPPGNTNFRLEIVPFPGQGCQDTLHTTIVASNDFMKLQVKDTVTACPSPGADITASAITAGSTPGITLQYFTDSSQAEILSDAAGITKSGKYYILGTSPAGCTEIKPVYALIRSLPSLVIRHPESVCSPATVNLTDANITTGSEPGLTLSYWNDTAATSSLASPQSIGISGKYFIKALDALGCSIIKPVMAAIGEPPKVVLSDIHSCGDLVFSKANPTIGSDPDVKFSYWMDAAASVSISPTQVFTTNTTVYSKAIGASGCSLIKPLQVNIHTAPVFTVTDPPPTTRPSTVDLESTVPVTPGWSYSYWLDENASKALQLPHQVSLAGTYYIKATTPFGCGAVNPVTVQIIDPPILPPNVFSPNNDGINDTWQIPILSAYPNCLIDIVTRNGALIYRSVGYNNPWDGRFKGKVLPADTYYYIIRVTAGAAPVGGSVTIVK